MKQIDIEYQSLDLTVFFDDCMVPDICAFAGRKGGRDTYTPLTCFTPQAVGEITNMARDALHERMADEAEEADYQEQQRYIRETCYDTPFA